MAKVETLAPFIMSWEKGYNDHAHSKGQEQDGLYGSLVIHPILTLCVSYITDLLLFY